MNNLIYQKWNYNKHQYEPYVIPDYYYLSTYENDMNKIVNCCQCLKEMKFGEGYTSMEVHTPVGFGYCVCEECYREEWKRRNDNRNS